MIRHVCGIIADDLKMVQSSALLDPFNTRVVLRKTGTFRGHGSIYERGSHDELLTV
jgi:hypothetical protein